MVEVSHQTCWSLTAVPARDHCWQAHQGRRINQGDAFMGQRRWAAVQVPSPSQASATISHKRRKPTSDHWQAIGPVFLWLTSCGSGSSGGILDWWDMQPLGGGIYWYGFCAGCQCIESVWPSRRAEGNGAALRVNYTQSHTQFTPANLVRERACKAAHACCGVVCVYNL